MERMSTLTTETRNDLHLTSTGVGHAIRETAPFPPSNFKTTRTAPLPPCLAPSPHSLSVGDVYQTTTGSAHHYKLADAALQFKKAPGSWKVHYTADTINKLDAKPWRRPLTMGHQSSEMKDQFQARPEAISRVIPHSGNPQPPTLADHFTEGPTKELIPSTVNREAKGRPFVPQNQAVLDRCEPYMTTNAWYHRTFSRRELGRYPKKDVATYWQCEDYPKAWGHGMRENPLSRRLVMTDPGPMRDRTVFKTGTTIPRLPMSLQPVSNGIRSVYSDTFHPPSERQRREVFHCPVPSTARVEAPDRSLQESVPHMYQTMNMTYGQGPAVVS